MQLGSVLRNLFIFALLATAGGPVYAAWDFLSPAALMGKVKKQVTKSEIGVGVKFLDVNVIEGLNFSANYALASEPSYVDGYYTRMDRYTLKTDVNIGDMLEDLDLPLSFGLHRNGEIIFARQFKSQSKSLTALPYGLNHLPLTAEKAIRDLVPGDFVSFEADMSIAVGVGTSALSEATVKIRAGIAANVVISGEFLVQAFRMANNKIRLKLISTRGRKQGVSARIDAKSTLEIFGFKTLDNFINSKAFGLLDLRPLAANFDYGHTDLTMLDYVFDLNDSRAAAAYDDLMFRRTKLKDIVAPDPILTRSKLQDRLIADATEIDHIYAEDKDLEASRRRIDRVFKGYNFSKSTSSGIKIGLSLVRLQHEQNYSQNRVISYDSNEVPQKYLVDTFNVAKLTHFLWDFYGSETSVTSNMLLTSNDDWAAQKFIAFTASREMRFKDLSLRDYRKIQDKVAHTIPKAEYQKIDWKESIFSKGKLANAYFRHDLYFHPKALASIPVRDPKQTAAEFRAFVKKNGHHFSIFQAGAPSKGFTGAGHEIDEGVTEIGRQFSMAFNPAYAAQDRYLAFSRLRSYSLWLEYGVSFLIAKMPDARTPGMISYEMKFSARNVPQVNYKFGDFVQEDLYKSLMYIQNVLNDRSFDLRLFTDANGQISFLRK